MRDAGLDREIQLDGLDPKAAGIAFDDLTNYLGQPLEQIRQEYWRYRAQEDVEAQRRVAQATHESEVLAYYQQTPHYLYELSYWEASAAKQAWFRVVVLACRRFGLRRVLDFGGGVGGLSVHLRAHGIECDHLDVPGKTFEYARWRFASRGLSVRRLEATQRAAWPGGAYDAVVAWDVLEHLFDLDAAIEQIGGLLRPGGRLISKSSFASCESQHLHIHLAKHMPYGDVATFNRLCARHQLEFVGQLKPNRISRLLRHLGRAYAVAGIRVSPRQKHGGNFLIHVKQPCGS
ncbi:MAG: class I SAM-dependent methyltransferase [Candidatus Omnitrophica bacterium]|nr:class I SAM-dependent methyltransferase [Candidatus Omnitrophota bacterium]